jgi:hypothetical protein
MGWEISAYTGAEVKIFLRYDDIDLLEVEDVQYSIDRKGRPGGAGIGHPKNRYHKFGVPEGTFSISKSYLNAGDQADLFADLISGVTSIQTESIASGATTHTTSYDVVGILAVVITGGDTWQMLYEGDDYTVNYATNTITFNSPTSNSGKILYLTDATGKDDDALDGSNHPFVFDIEWRDASSGAVLKRLRGCAPYQHSIKSGGKGEEPFAEDLSGQFLYLETSPS